MVEKVTWNSNSKMVILNQRIHNKTFRTQSIIRVYKLIRTETLVSSSQSQITSKPRPDRVIARRTFCKKSPQNIQNFKREASNASETFVTFQQSQHEFTRMFTAADT